MRGVGGPLLCIGDLLSDVGEEYADGTDQVQIKTVRQSDLELNSAAAHLPRLFRFIFVYLPQEHYNYLNMALAGSDHSWTDLTLKLCSTVETANKVIQCAHTHVGTISEKVDELERIQERADSAVAVARVLNITLNQKNHQSQ